MTIKRGQDWGRTAALPADAPVAATDAQLADLIAPVLIVAHRATAPGRSAPSPSPSPSVRPIGLVGGDLCRTLGGRGDRQRLTQTDAQQLPIDALIVTIDDRADEPLIAVAHVVIRRSWWHGPVHALMNAQYLGRYDVAPRSHPNDGRVDVIETTALSLPDRVKGWRRLPTGAHLPHPAITERRVTETSYTFERAMTVWVDGRRRAQAHTVHVRVMPDAFVVAI